MYGGLFNNIADIGQFKVEFLKDKNEYQLLHGVVVVATIALSDNDENRISPCTQKPLKVERPFKILELKNIFRYWHYFLYLYLSN